MTKSYDRYIINKYKNVKSAESAVAYLGGNMSKKKSIVLLTVISVILAVLLAMTFASFKVPFIKEGVYDYHSLLDVVDLDADLGGGLTYTLTLSEDSDPVEDINSVTDTLKDRLTIIGYSNYKVVTLRETEDDDYKIRISVKANGDVSTTTSDIEAVAGYGEVNFVDSDNNLLVSGKDGIKTAYAQKGYAQDGSGADAYYVTMEFTTKGYNAIKTAAETAEASSKTLTLKVVMGDDYDNALFSGTVSSSSFETTVSAQRSTYSDAEKLALQIRTGGLKYKYEISDPSTITAFYGKNAAKLTVIAVAAVMVVTMVLFGIFYKGLGIGADLSLLAQLLLQVLMLYLVPGITVSVGSVIGFVSALAAAAFAHAVILNRVKKEYASGKTFKAASSTAFTKTGLTVLDALIGAGAIALVAVFAALDATKAFAITFGIGVVIALLTSELLLRLTASIMNGISGGKEKFLGLKRED